MIAPALFSPSQVEQFGRPVAPPPTVTKAPEAGPGESRQGNAPSIIFIYAASSKSVVTACKALPLLPYSQSA